MKELLEATGFKPESDDKNRTEPVSKNSGSLREDPPTPFNPPQFKFNQDDELDFMLGESPPLTAADLEGSKS